ncbi:MAG: hypothetical protein MK052_01300 [Alphaproteobacteria bacterium]|nr:hypothetical protein [Alphaproteobacteria bacterium]
MVQKLITRAQAAADAGNLKDAADISKAIISGDMFNAGMEAHELAGKGGLCG